MATNDTADNLALPSGVGDGQKPDGVRAPRTISIPTTEGLVEVAIMFRRGPLVVNPIPKRESRTREELLYSTAEEFNITHVPTGLALALKLSLAEARTILKDLSSLNWNFDHASNISPTTLDAALLIIPEEHRRSAQSANAGDPLTVTDRPEEHQKHEENVR